MHLQSSRGKEKCTFYEPQFTRNVHFFWPQYVIPSMCLLCLYKCAACVCAKLRVYVQLAVCRICSMSSDSFKCFHFTFTALRLGASTPFPGHLLPAPTVCLPSNRNTFNTLQMSRRRPPIGRQRQGPESVDSSLRIFQTPHPLNRLLGPTSASNHNFSRDAPAPPLLKSPHQRSLLGIVLMDSGSVLILTGILNPYMM